MDPEELKGESGKQLAEQFTRIQVTEQEVSKLDFEEYYLISQLMRNNLASIEGSNISNDREFTILADQREYLKK